MIEKTIIDFNGIANPEIKHHVISLEQLNAQREYEINPYGCTDVRHYAEREVRRMLADKVMEYVIIKEVDGFIGKLAVRGTLHLPYIKDEVMMRVEDENKRLLVENRYATDEICKLKTWINSPWYKKAYEKFKAGI